MIEQFKDEYRWLSNFEPVEIRYEGITYPSVEHFYVAMKSTNPHTRKKVSELKTAGKAKRFGRKEIDIREDWDEIKIQVMEFALRQKFSKDPYKTKLIKTGDEHIQEGNTWGDTFWGVDLETGEGKNILGKLLMKIRKEVQ